MFKLRYPPIDLRFGVVAKYQNPEALMSCGFYLYWVG